MSRPSVASGRLLAALALAALLACACAKSHGRQVGAVSPESDGIEMPPTTDQPEQQTAVNNNNKQPDPTKQLINHVVQAHVQSQANSVTSDNAKGGVITMNKNVIKRVLKGGMTDEDDDLQDEAAVKKIEEQDKKKLREEELKQQREEQAKQIGTEKKRQLMEENQKQFTRELDQAQEHFEKKGTESSEKGNEVRRKRDKEDKLKQDRELALVKQSTLVAESEAESKKTLFNIRAEKRTKFFDEQGAKRKERDDKSDEEDGYKAKKKRLERDRKDEKREKEDTKKKQKERSRKDYQEMFIKRDTEKKEKETQRETEKQAKSLALAREVAEKARERESKAGLEQAQKQQQRLAERSEKENEQRAKGNELQAKAAERTVKAGQQAAERAQKDAQRQQEKGEHCDCRDLAVSWFANDQWISCPSGFLLAGMHRNGQDDLTGITHYSCCRPCRAGNQIVGTHDCQNGDWVRSFDATGWSWCPDGTYVEGFYKSSCNWIYCLEYAKCCKIQGSRGRADCDKQSSWWGSLDGPGWSRVAAHKFITGLYRTSEHHLHNIEEPYQCRWWSY